MKLHNQILIALVAGVLLGRLVPQATAYFSFLGDIFKYGLLAAIIIHFTHNFLLMAVVLPIAVAIQRRRRARRRSFVSKLSQGLKQFGQS